jgi:acyl carrier protein
MNVRTDPGSPVELRSWLETMLAQELRLSLDDVRRIRRFDEMGVDSILAVFIASELEERLGRPVDSNVLYEFADVDSLIRSLTAD